MFEMKKIKRKESKRKHLVLEFFHKQELKKTILQFNNK